MRIALADPFKLDPLSDGLALGAGAILTGTSLFLLDSAAPSLVPVLDPAKIFFLDRYMVYNYSAGIDTASDILQYAAVLAPAVLAAVPVSEWLTVGVMYSESILFSFGLKETLKDLVVRARPYMYWENPPQEFIDDGDYSRSFPSGHTTLAFTGATFGSYVFARYFPDSALRWPVFGVSYALAASVAVTRILSGSHFITDVIVGACIGTASGFLVPWLHERKAKDAPLALSAGPRGIMVTFRY